MKRLIPSLAVLLFISLILSINFVCASSTIWTKTYGAGSATAYSMVMTSDGGYALAGDGLLVKTDASGDMLWNKTYLGGLIYSVVQTSDGGYALGGTAESSNGDYDFWLIKTDAQGIMLWNKTYGGPDNEAANSPNSLVVTSDGGLALAGYTGVFYEHLDFWLVKTDSNGDMLWNKTYGGSTFNSCSDLTETSDGGFALVGSTAYGFVGSSDLLLVKTDFTGTTEWSKTYPGSANSLIETSDKGFAMAGSVSEDFWLAKTDEYGNVEWTQKYGTTEDETAHTLIETSDRGYAIAGVAAGFFDGQYNINGWMAKTDEMGNMQWNQTYGEAGDEQIYSLVETSDGAYVLAGYKTSTYAGPSYMWLIKTASHDIPEFPSWIILPLFLIATIAGIICKKRLSSKICAL
jgi:hypothetical protein